MRIRLKWKVAGSYTAVIVALALLMGIHAQRVVTERMTAALRGSLTTSCALVAAFLEASPGQDINRLVADFAARSDTRITIIALEGTVLADSDADATRMVPHDTRPEVVDARREGLGWAIRPSTTLGRDMLYVAHLAQPDGPVVRLSVHLDTVYAAVAGVRRAIAVTAFIGALLAILAGAWLAGGITRSLDELSAAAARIGEGDLSTRVHLDANDETADLASALNLMADSLSSARGRLERTAAHLESILAQMADGVIVVGPDETVQVFNSAAANLLQADAAAALGKPLSEVALHYEIAELPRRAMRLRTLARGEVQTPGDSPRTIAAVATPIAASDGHLQGAVMTLRDVTEVQRLQQVRQDFVTNASHELRTPVASIRSLAETLGGGALTDLDAGPRFLQQIVENTENLTRLLDDMLLLARLEKAAFRPEPQAVNVHAALTEAVARLAPQAEDKQTRLSVAADPQVAVWCSEDNLMAALVNLIDNAVKYTPAGGKVEVAAERLNDHVKLTVADNGPGIPEKHRERIFERFYRVDKGRSRNLGGTGLGLSIVRHAVESDGGQVWVEAPEQGGTRFLILLPASPEKR